MDFWSTEFWLPPGAKWEDCEGDGFRRITDLFYPIPLAFGLLTLRYCLNLLVFHPIGRYYGMRERKNRKLNLEPNDILEKAYRRTKSHKLDTKEVLGLAKKTQLDTRQVERWFRKRAVVDKPSKLDKFSECGWRFFFYSSASLGGLYVVWDQPWFADMQHCWYNYPHHKISAGSWWHCMLSLSFYWSLMISQFWDAKRSDFWEMFIHHVATLFLMSLAWVTNFIRISSLVLLVHDVADPFLEIAKMAKYANFSNLCWVLFGAFAFMFLGTRMYVYPAYILKNILVDRRLVMADFPSFYIILSMLLLLLCLHIFWACLLFKAIYRAAFNSKLEDVRSSSESYQSSEGEEKKK